MTLCHWLVVALLAAAPAWANPGYEAYRLAGEVNVDGRPDEAAWQALPEAGGFLLPGSTRLAIHRDTSFRVAHDDQALYLAVRCQEPRVGEPGVKLGGIEFFVTTSLAGEGVYYQVGLNGDGSGFGPTRFVRHMAMREPMSAPGYATAVALGEGEWSAELRLPFALFREPPPRAGRHWLVNLVRYAPAGAAEGETFTTWAWMPKLHWHLFNYYLPLLPRPAAAPPSARSSAAALLAPLRARQDDLRRRCAAVVAWEQRLAGVPNLVLDSPAVPARERVRDSVYGALIEQRGLRLEEGGNTLVVVTWPRPVTADTVLLGWGGPAQRIASYTLEVDDGQAWRLVAQVTDNDLFTVIHRLPAPIAISRLRLRLFDHGDREGVLPRFGVYHVPGGAP